MPKLKKDERAETFRKNNRKYGPVSQDYIRQMATSTPSYVLSIANRYEQSYRLAEAKINKAIQITATEGGIQDTIEYKIEELEVEEEKLAADFIKKFGYAKSVDARKHMLSMLGLNFQNQLKNNDFELDALGDIIKYRIAEVYRGNGDQKNLLSSANSSAITFYNSLSAAQKNKYSVMLSSLQEFLKEVNIEEVSKSPLIKRLITMITEDGGLRALAEEGGNIGDLRGLGGFLAEPVMGLLMVKTIQNIQNRNTRIFQKNGQINKVKIKSDIKKIVENYTGSQGKDVIVNNIVDSVAPINKNNKRSIKTGTNLSGMATYLTTDYIIDLEFNKSDKMGLNIDMKNPLRSGKKKQNTTYMTHTSRNFSEIVDNSEEFPEEVSEALQYYMFIMMSYINISKTFDREKLTVLSKIITYVMALSEETMNKLYVDIESSHSNIILIGGQFYFMSYVLRSILKTYFKTENTIINDARSLSIDASSLIEATKTLENSSENGLLTLKKEAATKAFPKDLNSRIGDIMKDSKVAAVLKKYQEASNSVSFQLKYTLDLNKIKNQTNI